MTSAADGGDDLDGTLADFRPGALLAFLSASRTSGVLAVRGNHGVVTIWLEDGIAVAAQSEIAGTDVVESLVEILRTPAGTFRYQHGQSVPPHLPLLDADDLLPRVGRRLQEWESLADAVPSLSLHVKLLNADGRDNVLLSGGAWSVSVAVSSGHASVASVAKHLGWSTYRTCTAVRELVDSGRASLVPPPKRRRKRAEQSVTGPAVWHPANQPLWPGAGTSERDRFSHAFDEVVPD
jgi:hypothetical protein